MDAVAGFEASTTDQAKSPKKEIIEKKYLNVTQNNDAAETIAALLSNRTAARREGVSLHNKIYEFDATVMGENARMVMTSVTGHLMEYRFEGACDTNWNVVDHLELFDVPIHKMYKKYTNNIIKTLEREISDCDGLIIWTYCNPEGENIGFEIKKVCEDIKPNIMVKRAIFSEITAPTLEGALQNLTELDENKSASVDVRMEIDLRSGAALTRLLTFFGEERFPQLGRRVISYGSCQIPTLGLLVERYKQHETPYWGIKVKHTIQDLTMEFLWNPLHPEVIYDEGSCLNYFWNVCSYPTATVETVNKITTTWKRPHPLNTVELIKLASLELMLTAEQVMTAADNLYERGIISYPHTDSNIFSNDFDLRTFVGQQTEHNVLGQFARLVAIWGPQPNNGYKSDPAHPPIYPTKMVNDLGGIEAQVYGLICRHFLACLSKDANVIETIVTIKIAGDTFTAKGFEMSGSSYLDVYPTLTKIHPYIRGDQFITKEMCMITGQTTVQSYTTEADLLALMAEYGIGTSNTYIYHLNTLKNRGYVDVINKFYLQPSKLGLGLYKSYEAMNISLTDLLFMGFREDLGAICKGLKDPNEVSRVQREKYKEIYKKIRDNLPIMENVMRSELNI